MPDEKPVVAEAKKPWLSKTLWMNFIAAASALFFPPVGDFVAQHPELAIVFWSGVNAVLRLLTKEQVSLKD